MTKIALGFTLSANATGLASGAAAASEALQKIGNAARKTSRDVSTIKTIEVGRMMGSGLSMAASAFGGAASSTVGYAAGITNAIDATNDLSERIGVGVEALQSLQLAAKLSGVDDIATPMQKLAVSIGKAAESGNIEAFERLGINFQKLQASDPANQFRQVARAISGLPTEAQRAAAAVELFGKAGVELLPLLGKNLDEIEKKGRRMGGIVSAEGVEAIGEMNDALDMVKASMGGIIGQVAGNLAPAVSAVSSEFIAFVESFNGANGTALADSITTSILNGAGAFAEVFDRFASYFGGWLESFGSFDNTLTSSSSTFAAVGDAFTAVGETLRYVFNTFEVVGNNISMGLGKFIETAGWVFRDKTAQEFGKTMAAAAESDLKKNKAEMEAAKANAGQAAANVLFGAPGGAAGGAESGPGPMARGVAAARAAFDNRNSPEAELKRQIEEAKREADRIKAADEAAKKRAEQVRQAKIARDAANAEKIDKASEFKREATRALGSRSMEALKVGDIRSSEGISAYMALATGREDPAVAEYRKSNETLLKLLREAEKQNNAPAVILGGAEG